MGFILSATVLLAAFGAGWLFGWYGVLLAAMGWGVYFLVFALSGGSEGENDGKPVLLLESLPVVFLVLLATLGALLRLRREDRTSP